MNTTTLALASIRYDDDDLQPRCEIDWSLIGEYAEAMKAGEAFPPVIVFSDGTSHWLADGFHRVHATRKAGLSGVEAEVREGDRRAAILYAMGANTSHGKRRTNADKGRAVRLLLKDSEWSKWSDREIARVCAVSQPFVSKIRKGSSDNGYQMRRFKRGGSEHEMVTTNIGRPTLPGPDGDTDVTALALSDDDYQHPGFVETPQTTRYGAIYADFTDVTPDTRPPTPADSAVLFLLTPAPTLRDGRSLVDQWGFTYADHAVVPLEATGMGTWFRPQHKLLLVGTRGDVEVPEAAIRYGSLADTEDVDLWVQNLIEIYVPRMKRLDRTGRITGIGWHH